MALFFVDFFVSIIVFISSVIYYSYTKQKFALFITLLDILLIAGTYFSKYERFPWTKMIFPFSTVDFRISGYVEGDYYGDWKVEADGDCYPEGNGRLTYKHFVDREFYAIEDSEGTHRALYYDGEFEYGRRMGHGIVVYEDGYRDEGEFYGDWEPEKTVFVGRRYKKFDSGEKYVELTIVANNGISGRDNYSSEYWTDVEEK